MDAKREQLIKCVREKSLLWDPRVPDYKDKDQKAQVWEALDAQLNEFLNPPADKTRTRNIKKKQNPKTAMSRCSIPTNKSNPISFSWSIITILLLSLRVYEVKGETCSSVVSFNTGLTPFVAKMDDRISPIIQSLKETNSDVLCLQEIWFERTLDKLVSALGKDYPYHYSVLHKSDGTLRSASRSWFSWLFPDAPCKKKEAAYIVGELGGCALKSGCVGPDPNKVGGCLAEKCSEKLKSRKLSQSCLSCTMFSLSSITSTLSECNRVVGANNRFNGPGLVVFSKKKMSGTKYSKFFPFSKLFVERGYIETKIEDVGKVVCTHLSAHFPSYFEFDTYFKTYESQQAAEIRRLGKFRFQEHILMGDLNTGPSIRFRSTSKNIVSVYPLNFRRLMYAGYSDPYIQDVQLCTYCVYNTLTTKGKSHILDHILLRGRAYKNVSTKRVLVHEGGKPLSDHYGVEVSFCKD